MSPLPLRPRRRPGDQPQATATQAHYEPAQPSAGTQTPAPAQSQPRGKQAPKAASAQGGLLSAASPTIGRAPTDPTKPHEPSPAPNPTGDAQSEARAVVELWVDLMEEQDREARVTDLRVAQVGQFMRKSKISHDELSAYLRWVFRSDETWPKFMRKPERPYLTLDNLLRRAHLAAHLDTAVSWDMVTGQGAYHGARFVAYYGGRAFT